MLIRRQIGGLGRVRFRALGTGGVGRVCFGVRGLGGVGRVFPRVL
jgi:hypothetical protein